MVKVNNEYTRTASVLMLLIVNFEHIEHLAVVFLFMILSRKKRLEKHSRNIKTNGMVISLLLMSKCNILKDYSVLYSQITHEINVL